MLLGFDGMLMIGFVVVLFVLKVLIEVGSLWVGVEGGLLMLGFVNGVLFGIVFGGLWSVVWFGVLFGGCVLIGVIVFFVVLM